MRYNPNYTNDLSYTMTKLDEKIWYFKESNENIIKMRDTHLYKNPESQRSSLMTAIKRNGSAGLMKAVVRNGEVYLVKTI